MSPLFTVRQTTDGVDIPAVISGYYEEPPIEFDKPPEFGLTVPNQAGIEMYRLFTGKEVTISRAGATGIIGVIDTPKGSQGTSTSKVEVKGVSKGYTLLKRLDCTDWSFYDPTGGAAAPSPSLQPTVQAAVVINPWEWFIFRAPNGTLDAAGQPPAVDGVTFDDAMRTCIGTKAIMQMDFQDNSFFMNSQVKPSTNAIQVYRDGDQSQLRPALQRVRFGGGLKSGGQNLESIPFTQNNPDVSTGGNISSVSVIFIGKRDASNNNITVDVCRNASLGTSSRTYTNVSLTFTANFSNGLDKWEGTVSLSGSETLKNSLGFRISIAGTGGSTTGTYLYYGKLVATTASETGVLEGSISTYTNGQSFTNLTAGLDWVETNVQGMNRMKAIETLRTLTVSNPSTNPNPHWDAWLSLNSSSQSLFNFANRRGSVIARTYSFPNLNLKDVTHEYDGTELAYHTIINGPGSGSSRVFVSTKDASLYDADRDPFGGTRLYGDAPQVLQFTDANERSYVSLVRKGQAFHKLHRDPIEKITVKLVAEHIPYFTVGDSITIDNVNTRTTAASRVQTVRRSFSGVARESIDVTLGNDSMTFADHVSNNQSEQKVLTIKPIPTDSISGLAGNGVYFDKDHAGPFSLNIPNPELVDRVGLHLDILPWQATSKQVVSTPITGFTSTVSSSQNFAAQTTLLTLDMGQQYTFTDFDQIEIRYFIGLSAHPNSSTTSNPIRVAISMSDDNTNLHGVSNRWWETTVNSINDKLTVSGDDPGIANATFRYIKVVAETPLDATNSTANDVRLGVVLYPKNLTTTFGIFQFDGDGGTGTGSALFVTNVSVSIDPALTNGIPTSAQFTANQHPMIIGQSSTAPGSYDIDITGFLTTNANGQIQGGIHRVWFLGPSIQSFNAQGLGVVAVTPVITYKQGKV